MDRTRIDRWIDRNQDSEEARKKHSPLDFVLGVFGALAGAYLFMLLSPERAAYLSMYGVLSAIAGAALVLFINYGIRRGFADTPN